MKLFITILIVTILSVGVIYYVEASHDLNFDLLDDSMSYADDAAIDAGGWVRTENNGAGGSITANTPSAGIIEIKNAGTFATTSLMYDVGDLDTEFCFKTRVKMTDISATSTGFAGGSIQWYNGTYSGGVKFYTDETEVLRRNNGDTANEWQPQQMRSGSSIRNDAPFFINENQWYVITTMFYDDGGTQPNWEMYIDNESSEDFIFFTGSSYKTAEDTSNDGQIVFSSEGDVTNNGVMEVDYVKMCDWLTVAPHDIVALDSAMDIWFKYWANQARVYSTTTPMYAGHHAEMEVGGELLMGLVANYRINASTTAITDARNFAFNLHASTECASGLHVGYIETCDTNVFPNRMSRMAMGLYLTGEGLVDFGDGGSDLITGTATFTAGSKTVTCDSGCSWDTALATDDWMRSTTSPMTGGNPFYKIASVDSSTQVTLVDSWATTTRSTSQYRAGGAGKYLKQLGVDLIEEMESGNYSSKWVASTGDSGYFHSRYNNSSEHVQVSVETGWGFKYIGDKESDTDFQTRAEYIFNRVFDIQQADDRWLVSGSYLNWAQSYVVDYLSWAEKQGAGTCSGGRNCLQAAIDGLTAFETDQNTISTTTESNIYDARFDGWIPQGSINKWWTIYNYHLAQTYFRLFKDGDINLIDYSYDKNMFTNVLRWVDTLNNYWEQTRIKPFHLQNEQFGQMFWQSYDVGLITSTENNITTYGTDQWWIGIGGDLARTATIDTRLDWSSGSNSEATTTELTLFDPGSLQIALNASSTDAIDDDLSSYTAFIEENDTNDDYAHNASSGWLDVNWTREPVNRRSGIDLPATACGNGTCDETEYFVWEYDVIVTTRSSSNSSIIGLYDPNEANNKDQIVLLLFSNSVGASQTYAYLCDTAGCEFNASPSSYTWTDFFNKWAHVWSEYDPVTNIYQIKISYCTDGTVQVKDCTGANSIINYGIIQMTRTKSFSVSRMGVINTLSSVEPDNVGSVDNFKFGYYDQVGKWVSWAIDSNASAGQADWTAVVVASTTPNTSSIDLQYCSNNNGTPPAYGDGCFGDFASMGNGRYAYVEVSLNPGTASTTPILKDIVLTFNTLITQPTGRIICLGSVCLIIR